MCQYCQLRCESVLDGRHSYYLFDGIIICQYLLVGRMIGLFNEDNHCNSNSICVPDFICLCTETSSLDILQWIHFIILNREHVGNVMNLLTKLGRSVNTVWYLYLESLRTANIHTGFTRTLTKSLNSNLDNTQAPLSGGCIKNVAWYSYCSKEFHLQSIFT